MLTIGALRGEFDGMLQNRTFEIIWISPDYPGGMDFDVEPDAMVRNSGDEVIVRM